MSSLLSAALTFRLGSHQRRVVLLPPECGKARTRHETLLIDGDEFDDLRATRTAYGVARRLTRTQRLCRSDDDDPLVRRLMPWSASVCKDFPTTTHSCRTGASQRNFAPIRRATRRSATQSWCPCCGGSASASRRLMGFPACGTRLTRKRSPRDSATPNSLKSACKDSAA